MTMPEWIKPGSMCVTRSGHKARIYSVDGEGYYPVHGAFYNRPGWTPTTWATNGRHVASDGPRPLDLKGPWIDKPEIDWSAMPAWFNYVAMDGSGEWFCYTEKPGCSSKLAWEHVRGELLRIPTEYSPKWSGDWRESLIVRPGYED